MENSKKEISCQYNVYLSILSATLKLNKLKVKLTKN